VAYFGNRTLRHVEADMRDIAASGFDYVVHCMTESDLLDGVETMRRIVEISHAAGLEVHLDPWGFAGVFGGEAHSKFVAMEADACQVLADGSRVGVICLHQPVLRELLHRWVDTGIEIGADLLFWDEPHWFPGDLWYYGEERGHQSLRWSCRCRLCLERFSDNHGRELPLTLDDEVVAFRQRAVYDLLVDVVAYGSGRGVRNALCLLPHGQYHHLVSLPDWEPFVQIPGLDVFGTDPYWAVTPPLELEPYVRPNAAHVRELCDRYGLKDQFWIQAYGFAAGHEGEPAEAIRIAREEGMTDLAVWAYRCCEPMSRLWPANPERVWEVVLESLRSGGARKENALSGASPGGGGTG
jgi:hypothetical protein